jgi:hypothetical protein
VRVLDAFIDIDAPADVVWGVVHDVARYPEWNPFVRRVEGLVAEGERVHVTVRVPGKRLMTFKAIVLRLDPERELRWRGRWLLPALLEGDHSLTVQSLAEGRARFRTREYVTGLLLPLLRTETRQIQAGFDELAVAVKSRSERLAAERKPPRGPIETPVTPGSPS